MTDQKPRRRGKGKKASKADFLHMRMHDSKKNRWALAAGITGVSLTEFVESACDARAALVISEIEQ